MASALGPHGTVTVVWTKRIEQRDLLFERHRDGGSWSELRRLGYGGVLGVVPDAHGETTVVWIDDRTGLLETAARRANGQWTRVQRVARGIYEPTLAANRRGDIVVAWSAGEGVGVATRRDGELWRITKKIPSVVTNPYAICAAVDGSSRAVVLWGRDPDGDGPGRHHVAWSQTKGDGTWSDAGYFDHGVPDAVDSCNVAMNTHGQAVATWVDSLGTEVASFDFTHGWTRPRVLKDHGITDLWISDTATTVAVSYDARWMSRQAGGAWRRGGVFEEVGGLDSGDADGDGSQLALIYYGTR